jgi:hypothetical protein
LIRIPSADTRGWDHRYLATAMSMIREQLVVRRDDLYEQVWSTPMRTLAQSYGLSDVGLAKTCKRLKVPVPGRGYWAKKAAGHAVRRKPLPALPPNAAESLRQAVFTPRPTPIEPSTASGPVAEQAAFEAMPENLIVVSDTLRSANPLVRKTAQILKPSGARDREYVVDYQQPHLDVSVSRNLLNRALRIMDAVVKAFEERGWKVSLDSGSGYDRHRKTYVTVLGHRIAFGVREPLRKIKNEPAKPIRGYDGRMYTPYQAKYRDEPSGRLALVIRQSWGRDVRKSWDESESRRLEDRLNEFMVGIVAEAVREEEFHREAQERQRVLQEAEERRRAEERKREEEAARIKSLEQQADDWAKSVRIAAYLDAVRSAAGQTGSCTEPGTELDSWLRWAEEHARRINPLNERLQRVVGTKRAD